MWINVGEVWESVLGCRRSSLKRGVGEVRRGGGVKKCGGGVRKCVAGVEGWENMGEVWESVLGVAESEKRCVGESGKRCGKVYWGAGEVA